MQPDRRGVSNSNKEESFMVRKPEISWRKSAKTPNNRQKREAPIIETSDTWTGGTSNGLLLMNERSEVIPSGVTNM